jgi:hypothetical protein
MPVICPINAILPFPACWAQFSPDNFISNC